VLRWTVKTRPGFADSADVIRFSSADLRQITAAGVTRPIGGVAPDCVTGDRFPDGERLQPASTYVGEMGVVLSEPGGSLVFAPSWAKGGWEWPIA
jgi:hypothetical protein